MDLNERNELRIRICELDIERDRLLSIAEPYRPTEKIQRLTIEIDAMEVEIRRALIDNGSS